MKRGSATYLFFDTVWLLLFAVIVTPPLVAIGLLHRLLIAMLPPTSFPWLALLLPAYYVLLCLGVLLMTGLVRPLLGRMKPGVYPFPGHPQATRWLLNFALQRIVHLPLFKPFVFAVASLRYLFFRALGARVAFGVLTASDTMVLDAGLHTVGEGCMLAGGVVLAGHMIAEDSLILGGVRLGRGVQVLAAAFVGPNVHVGDNAVIGPESRLMADIDIGEDVHLGMHTIVSRGVRIAADAVIGHDVSLGPGVVVGEAAVIDSHAIVPKNTHIASGERFPPRLAHTARRAKP